MVPASVHHVSCQVFDCWVHTLGFGIYNTPPHEIMFPTGHRAKSDMSFLCARLGLESSQTLSSSHQKSYQRNFLHQSRTLHPSISDPLVAWTSPFLSTWFLYLQNHVRIAARICQLCSDLPGTVGLETYDPKLRGGHYSNLSKSGPLAGADLVLYEWK